jgi:hypothetical protein
MDNEKIIKELAEKYEFIKKQVEEYNEAARLIKIGSRVGCMINEVPESEKDDEENSYYEDLGFSYKGWVPSSVGC